MHMWFTQYTHNVGWLIAISYKSTLWWFAPFLEPYDGIPEYLLYKASF